MKRRTFLTMLTATALQPGRQAFAFAPFRSRQSLIVIRDIDLGTAAEPLRKVLDACLGKGLPVSCVVDFSARGAAHPPVAGKLPPLLQDYATRNAGIFEIVPYVTNLASQSPYFQARAAFAAHKDMAGSLQGYGPLPVPPARATSIACADIEHPNAPSGLRSAGIRNVLMLPRTDVPVRSEKWDDGILRVFGGRRVAMRPGSRSFAPLPETQTQDVAYISARDFSGIPADELSALASEFTERALSSERSVGLSHMRLADAQLRDNFDYRRFLGLHFFHDRDRASSGDSALEVFRRELFEAGVPSSISAPAGTSACSAASQDYWVETPDDRAADPAQMRNPTTALEPGEQLENLRCTPGAGYQLGAAIRLVPDARYGLPGVDEKNVLSIPTMVIEDADDVVRLAERPVPIADVAIWVSSDVLRNRPIRNTLKRTLIDLGTEDFTTALTLPELARSILPRSPHITHFRRAEALDVAPEKPRGPMSRGANEKLMADARNAWNFFEKWTNPASGLCPATVNSGELRLHEAVTMWDVGSHINALMAAVDLGLISTERFQRSIAQIMPNIAGRRWAGRLLPQGWIRTDRKRWGNQNFDGSDAGRLLAALDRLRQHPATKEDPTATVESWDLEQIIHNGEIMSVTNGQFHTTYHSHCAHYAARAFGRWGFEVRSPYEVFAGQSRSDGRMSLLEVVGRIGPMGAEPLLLEALELGISLESAYLADALFSAQLEEFQETGRLICVSEGPIDRDPWFTYQGLLFDAPGRVWGTDTVDSLKEHRSAEFAEANLVLSCKAAFLWAAHRPHDFSDRLLDQVRRFARTPNGFASSINVQSGKATAGYTDINTNAVILQAIAHILRRGDTKS